MILGKALLRFGNGDHLANVLNDKGAAFNIDRCLQPLTTPVRRELLEMSRIQFSFK